MNKTNFKTHQKNYNHKTKQHIKKFLQILHKLAKKYRKQILTQDEASTLMARIDEHFKLEYR